MRSFLLAAVVACAVFSGIVATSGAAAAGQRPCPCASCQGCVCRPENGWLVAETANFSVWSRLPHHETVTLAGRCEELRESIRERWLSDTETAAWTPKCAVVVHANAAEYGRTFGATANPSVGCTTVTADAGRVVFRRIDLRADAADWRQNALPHELTHVVLADRFAGRELPHWLNEGLAMTAETAELQARRRSVLREARSSGSLPALERFVNLDNPMLSLEADVVYALSYSLVDYLREREGERRLLEFVDRALETGCDAALREVYAIEGGVRELERAWASGMGDSRGSPKRAVAATERTVTINAEEPRAQ